MKLSSKLTLLFFASVLTAPCDPVLSIFDPLSGTFNPTPPTQSLSVEYPGSVFTLIFEASGSMFSIPPSGPSDLYGYSFDISFSPSELQVVSNGVTESGYFAKNGIGIEPIINNTSGLITNLNDFVAGPGPGENLSISTPILADDPLVAVMFKVVGSGTSYVSIPQNSDLFFVDSNNNFSSPIVGTAEVISLPKVGSGAPGGPAQTPEPSTAELLATAGFSLVLVSQLSKRKKEKVVRVGPGCQSRDINAG